MVWIEDHESRGVGAWLFRVPYHEGESLLSLASRQIRLCEMTLPSFIQVVGCKKSFGWYPELDIAPRKSLIQGMASALSVPTSELRGGTLDQILRTVLSPSVQQAALGHHWNPRHLPWVLPNSWQYGRTPTGPSSGGIPYCPLCFSLTEDPWFPIENRLSLTLICRNHGVWLRDDCPKCGSPIGPMTMLGRADWSLGDDRPLCTSCNSAELVGTYNPFPDHLVEPADEHEIAFQTALHHVFLGLGIEIKGVGPLRPSQYLSGLRYASTMISYISKEGWTYPPEHSKMPQRSAIRAARSKVNQTMEFLPLALRRLRFKWMRWICDEPLNRWHVLRQLCGHKALLNKSWAHPWEQIEIDGEFLKAGTWQHANSNLTAKANLGQVKEFFDLTTELDLNLPLVCGLLGGGVSLHACKVWRNIPSRRMPCECRHRINHLMRIWSDLMSILGAKGAAIHWLKSTDTLPELHGQSVLAFLCEDPTGNNLEFISRAIDKGLRTAQA